MFLPREAREKFLTMFSAGKAVKTNFVLQCFFAREALENFLTMFCGKRALTR